MSLDRDRSSIEQKLCLEDSQICAHMILSESAKVKEDDDDDDDHEEDDNHDHDDNDKN